MSIISPSWSGYETRQTLGRIHRAGSKTPAIQKLVYVAKTYEESIAKLIENKLKTIDAINDGDFEDEKLNIVELEEQKNIQEEKTPVIIENNKNKYKVKEKINNQ